MENDVPLLAKWLFDPYILHWLQLSEDPPQLRTEEAVRERYERMQADPFTETWRIDIGEKDVWGRGYGARAVRRLLEHAFEDLGLRRVFAMADEDNTRVIRCLESCGFAREGLLRSHRLRHGLPTDMVVMGVLDEEYR